MASNLSMWRRPPISFSILICVVFGFAIFFELGRMDVVSDNEGQRAAPPAEMLRTGHYSVPTINEETYLAKPPLLYWSIAAVYWATGGPSEWAARVPSALCAIALVLCVYLVLRKAAGEKHARWAALMTGIAPYVMERSRWAELDVPLTLAMFVAIAALHLGTGRVRPVVIGGIACGAAMMLKGPVAFPFMWAGWVASVVVSNEAMAARLAGCVRWSAFALGLDLVLRGIAGMLKVEGFLTFPWGLILLIAVWTWPAARADWRSDRRMLRWCLATLVGAMCVTPWAIAVLREVGWDYVRALVDEQVVERTHTASRINGGSSLYFFIGAPFMLAPWGLLMPALLSRSLWRDCGAWYRFAVAFAGISICAFSLFAGKEYEYILPAVPFLASALAFVWLHEGDYGTSRALNTWVRAWKAVLPGLIAVGAIVTAIYFSAAYPKPIFVIEVWTFILVAAIAWRAFAQIDGPARLAAVSLAAILIVLVSRSFYYTGDQSPKSIIRLAADLQRQGYAVESSKMYPAFAFYAGAPIGEIQDVDVSKSVDAIKGNLLGDTPYFLLTRKEIAETFLQEIPEAKRRVIAGPVTSKHHVLIGNVASPIRSHEH